MTSLTLKVVIRCRDFAASRDFYTRVLRLPAVEEWEEPQGRGCIFAFGEDRGAGQNRVILEEGCRTLASHMGVSLHATMRLAQ
jgi:catechol 2,3-dioxygenase-like lactoylglutathione lyase family enzyme